MNPTINTGVLASINVCNIIIVLSTQIAQNGGFTKLYAVCNCAKHKERDNDADDNLQSKEWIRIMYMFINIHQLGNERKKARNVIKGDPKVKASSQKAIKLRRVGIYRKISSRWSLEGYR